MKLSDIWWLMKEIWPWTIGVTLLGAVLNLFLFRKDFGLLLGAVGIASLFVAAAFQIYAGWGGGEFGIVGVALNYMIIWMPAGMALLFGASMCRMVTSIAVIAVKRFF